MAQNRSPILFAVATLLLLAAAAPLANAQLLPNIGVGQLPIISGVLGAIRINGTICCTNDGNCPGGPLLSGVPVSLVCTIGGNTVVVANTITTTAGAFFFNINNLAGTALGTVTGVLGGSIPCVVTADLPLGQALCPTLNAVTGTLTGVTTIVGIVLSQVGGILVGILSVTFRVVSLG